MIFTRRLWAEINMDAAISNYHAIKNQIGEGTKICCVIKAEGYGHGAVELAKLINGEIISADSMQIYDEMDIGTAKPTIEEMDGVKHYLIGNVSPTTRYSVANYKKDASLAIEEILQKGKTPIIVGGTGLYVDSLVQGIEYDDLFQEGICRKKH